MTFADAANDNAPLVVPYRPRRHFLNLHASEKRWIFVCAHRRAGKTVALANQLLRAAYLNPREWPPPRYGYVGPSFEQAKDLVWSYLKQYTSPIDGVRYLEGELAIVLPHNGAIIKLYGGMSAYERMRGMYFDGIVLDEYPLLQKTVFSTVVRPCLADYRGFAIVSGTSNGDDHFNALRLRAMEDERWDVFLIPLSETGEEALSYPEAKELTQDMSADEYAREMECSFEAPVEGAYFAEALNAMSLQGRVCPVPVDLAAPVITSWDLGVHDYCSIWLWQNVGKEVHFVDYVMAVGKGLDHWASVLRKKATEGGFEYRCHLLPHDIEAREISSAKSRRATLQELIPHDEPIITVPRIRSKEDGIHAARAMLGSAYFDAEKCKVGLAMLRGYHKSAMGQPVHGPGPHCVDGDTLVLTRLGPQRIKSLPETGEVLTPCGWRPYREPRITRLDAPLVAVMFSDGLTVNCTADHLFLTASGWTYAGDLGPSSMILSSLTRRRSISMAFSTAFTSASDIFRAPRSGFMSMFGSMFSGRGLKDRISAIMMATFPTIRLRTSNACPQANISNGPGVTGTRVGYPIRSAISPANGRPSGTVQRQDGHGINGTPPRCEAGNNGSARRWLAFIAERVLRVLSGRPATPRNTAPSFAKAAIGVESVTRLPRRADVWCLTVDDPGHWWTLANGAVTHNSHGADAFQTAAVGFHLVSGISAAMLRRGPMRRRLRGIV